MRHARLIIADTQVRVWPRYNGNLYLIDEALTRIHRASGRKTSTGRRQPASFDKQFVRDWLEAQKGTSTAGAGTPADVLGRPPKNTQKPSGCLPIDNVTAEILFVPLEGYSRMQSDANYRAIVQRTGIEDGDIRVLHGSGFLCASASPRPPRSLQ